MKMTENIINMVLNAEGKALATVYQEKINVVPVSSVKIVDNSIILVDYFLGKTLENIQHNPEVSLACWKGLEGYQIKATADYKVEGEIFSGIKGWIAEILPERTVRGVLILKPNEIFDVSANAEQAGTRVV